MNADDIRKIVALKLTNDTIERIFSREEVSQRYQEVRSSVETYYQKLMDGIKKDKSRFRAITPFIESDEVQRVCESFLKEKLLNIAIVEVLDDNPSEEELTKKLQLVINERNVKQAIADWMEILRDILEDIIREEFNISIIKAGMNFLKDS